MAILQGMTDHRHKMALQLAVWVGNHSGELQALRWSSIIWGHNAALIRESVWEGKSNLPKTRKGYRKVVLSDEQMKVLREYKDKNYPNAGPEDWALPGKRGHPMDLGHLMSRYIRPPAEKVGVPGLRWNAFRNFNNSVMLNEGADVKTRMDRLGHVNDRINLIYSHVDDAAQKHASEAIWKVMESARTKLEEAQLTPA